MYLYEWLLSLRCLGGWGVGSGQDTDEQFFSPRSP